jgi:hypothetical protein
MDAGLSCVFDACCTTTGHENFSLDDLTVPNGAFWVDDDGLELKGAKGKGGDESGNGAKPKKGKKAAKKGDDDSSDDSEDDE